MLKPGLHSEPPILHGGKRHFKKHYQQPWLLNQHTLWVEHKHRSSYAMYLGFNADTIGSTVFQEIIKLANSHQQKQQETHC